MFVVYLRIFILEDFFCIKRQMFVSELCFSSFLSSDGPSLTLWWAQNHWTSVDWVAVYEVVYMSSDAETSELKEVLHVSVIHIIYQTN